MSITLRRTCYACPEQYDAFDETGAQVGYLRLRHGEFTVECPDVGGDLVFEATIDKDEYGGGIFDEIDRAHYLEEALNAINRWRAKAK